MTAPIQERAPNGGRGRASLSSSPLARPKSLIHILAARVQDYIYFPAPDPLYLVLGTVAANMMTGMPVWLMLVGASSSGKTLLIEMLRGLGPDTNPDGSIKLPMDPEKRLHIVGAIKSTSALLSGVPKKDQTKGATGGMLRTLGSRGMFGMTDFTGMLSLPREPLHEVIGSLRDVFDGNYSRPLGGEGGKVLSWRGKVGFIGGVTPVIDRHSGLIGELGERWVYYRFPETDGWGEMIKSANTRNPEKVMAELRELVVIFFDDLGLTWTHDEERRELTKDEVGRFYAMASFTVAARSGVPRDSFQGYEIVDVASKEGVPRLAGELIQLYLGLERIGIEADERWRIVGKIAMDSIRQTRVLVLQTLEASKEPVKMSAIKALLQCGTRTCAIVVEDLMIHGMVEKSGKTENRSGGEDGATGGWRLTKWARRQYAAGWVGNGNGVDAYSAHVDSNADGGD